MTLFPGIAEPGQPHVQAPRAEPIQEVAYRLCTPDRDHGDALGAEIPATPSGQRLDCEPVARAFDEHDRSWDGLGSCSVAHDA